MNKICSICGNEIKGIGHNPKPYDGEKCCDECNIKYVIPRRIKEANLNNKDH